eukprot:jgi/Picsp_1/5237/NSC_02600-R1_---NA---
MAFSPSAGDPASPRALTNALPTMTPSAPQSLICLACSGPDTPKPTAILLSVVSLRFWINPSTRDSVLPRIPVTPVRDTRYTNPILFSAICCMRGIGVVGVDNKTKSSPNEEATLRISEVSSSGISGTKSPEAPALLACSQNFSSPLAIIGLKYVNITIGALMDGDTFCITSNTLSRMTPFFKARVAAAWMVGPSASGSEYGTPNSITSAPIVSNS